MFAARRPMPSWRRSRRKSPAQVAFGTGGPKAPELLMTLVALRAELSGLELLVGREIGRDVTEGDGHTGRGAVVQILARRNE